MVTQLQPDVRAYLHGGEVIKRYIRVEEVAHEYGFSVEETEYIAKAASSLYKLTRIHLVKKERFDEFMKHIYKVPGTNKQIIKKFARIGEASIIYSIGRHRFIELARAAGATYKIIVRTTAVIMPSPPLIVPFFAIACPVIYKICNQKIQRSGKPDL